MSPIGEMQKCRLLNKHANKFNIVYDELVELFKDTDLEMTRDIIREWSSLDKQTKQQMGMAN